MWRKLAESLLLVGALAFLIPLPPSDPSPISFLPLGAVATLLFFASRLLRHGGFRFTGVVASGMEAICFLMVAWAVNVSANVLNNSLSMMMMN